MKNTTLLLITSAVILLATGLSSCSKGDANFVGSYQTIETSSLQGPLSYPVTIAANQYDDGKVLIYNAYNHNSEMQATITSETTIVMPYQNYKDDFRVSGSGTLDKKTGSITMRYIVSDGSFRDTINGTWNKQ